MFAYTSLIRYFLAISVIVYILAGCKAETSTNDAPAKKFINTFLVYYGSGPTLVEGDMARLAKFDLLDIDRFRYNNIGFKSLRDSVGSIHALNPRIQVFIYEMGPRVSNFHDDSTVMNLNDLGRYDVARGHSMGSLNGNHPDLFLLDNSGSSLVQHRLFKSIAQSILVPYGLRFT